MSLEYLFKKQGLNQGNILSTSKSDYLKNNQDSFPIFNALIFNENQFNENKNSEPIWSGDLDLSKDSDKLLLIAKNYDNIVVTNEHKDKIRIFRSNEFQIEPVKFYDYLNKDDLGEIILRDNTENNLSLRTLDLNILWKNVLKYELNEPTINPNEIKSVILFGSTVNKAPYEKHENQPYKIFKWDLKRKESIQTIEINDIDICVLTENEQNYRMKEIKLLDLGYPFHTYINGNLEILYTTVDNFIQKLENKTQNSMNIMKDGLIISDDGTFTQLKKPYEKDRKQNYVLTWEFNTKLYNNFKLNNKIKLNGKLDFVGNIPYIIK